jgi:antitoxin VapB
LRQIVSRLRLRCPSAISKQKGSTMTTTTVFTNNRSQAIRLPVEMRLPEGVKRVDVRLRGCERIIAPVGQSWDSFFLDSPAVADDFLEVRASQNQAARLEPESLSLTPAHRP